MTYLNNGQVHFEKTGNKAIDECLANGNFTIEKICDSCGEFVHLPANFCPKCGTPLARECASCRTKLKPSMKFCPECGAKV